MKKYAGKYVEKYVYKYLHKYLHRGKVTLARKKECVKILKKVKKFIFEKIEKLGLSGFFQVYLCLS